MNNIADEITFTNAKLTDLSFIVEIYNQTIASRMVTADTSPVTVDNRIEWFNAHNVETRPLWLINYKNQPCGWVSLSTFYGRPAYAKTVEISLYIDEAFRGKKIGQHAVIAIEQFAQQHKIDTILGYIFAHNSPSLALFEKLGYRKWGHLFNIAELDGIKRDLIILGKQIVH
ncbi:N-acetyltransferase family protein [Orbus sturtevantii]|uniref:GNAT family N-acetyltransferase n=1 Tax=Orbus sturtevantii TaxID=3074109 RepID=UPI00370D1744